MTSAGAEMREAIVTHRPELLRRATELVRSPVHAEDLVQDTVVRALAFEHGFKPGTNPRAWLHRILFSIFATQARRQRLQRDGQDELCEVEAHWVHGDPPPAETFLSPAVAHALASIPAQFAAAVVIVHLREHTVHEAAAELGVPAGTVLSRLYRGRCLLAELLGDRDDHDPFPYPVGDAPGCL